MAGPEPGPFIQHFCHMFMIKSLIFLAVVLAGRLRPMISDNSLAAILGNAHGNFRMFFMKPVKPGSVVLHLPAVPAKIVIIAFYIRNPVYRAVRGRHGHMGNGGKPCGIHPFAQFIQFFVIFHQLLRNAPN